MTIWRRTCARAVPTEGDRTTIQTTGGKVHILVADSTGIATTDKGRRTDLGWNVECSSIKLHVLADEESQKMPAFRITDTGGGGRQEPAGHAGPGPGRAGHPAGGPGRRSGGAGGGGRHPGQRERHRGHNRVCVRLRMLPTGGCRAARLRVKRTPAATVRGDGWYDSRECSPTAGSAACAPQCVGTVDANCRSEAVLERLGGGCTAAQLARMGGRAQQDPDRHGQGRMVRRGP